MRESFISKIPETHDHISREAFDEQLSIRQQITAQGGTIEFNVVTPEKIRSDIPTIYVGGFLTGSNLYADTLYDIAREGTEVFYMNPTKGIPSVETVAMNQLTETYNIPESVLHKVAAIEALISSQGFERVDVVGHSQGALVLSVLTALHPGLVRNLVLDCPFGLQPERTTTSISVAFIHEGLRVLWQSLKEGARGNFPYTKATLNTIGTAVKEFSKNTAWRFTHEIPDGASLDIAPLLKDIKDTSKDQTESTTITLLTAQNDSLFSPEKFEARLDVTENPDQPLEDGEGPFKYIDVWAMYADKEANHAAPMLEKSGLITQLLSQEK